MQTFADRCAGSPVSCKTWLVTGAAGFIGSNLTEALLRLGQRVVGLDNFMTGHEHNLLDARACLTASQWANFRLLRGDVRDAGVCEAACHGVDYVLHQAALGSVPRSIQDPLLTHSVNATGFLNVIRAAQAANVRRFVYASSSSVYGDYQAAAKAEDALGRPLSPYAVSKLANEQYAQAFGHCYGTETIGLRYFNVFGRRQDPQGAYAAVVPAWIAAMLRGEPVHINGDGETSRDFCYIENVVQANLLAATASDPRAINQVFNIAVGQRASLNELFEQIRARLAARFPALSGVRPLYRPFRAGDIRHSQADISKARALLGYEPTHQLGDGLDIALDWYVGRLGPAQPRT